LSLFEFGSRSNQANTPQASHHNPIVRNPFVLILIDLPKTNLGFFGKTHSGSLLFDLIQHTILFPMLIPLVVFASCLIALLPI